MADNDAFTVADTAFGPVGLVAPLVPDVTLVHGAVADHEGNVALSEPLLEGAWGAWAARRGVVATVERVVESLDGLGHRVKIPAHRVLAVVEAPFGAHPGGLYAPGLPVSSYGEDIPFWGEARAATRRDFDAWARHWVLEPATHDRYLERLGRDRLDWLSARTDPESWRQDAEAHPVDTPTAVPPSRWEHAAAYGARELETVAATLDADAVLAGAGVANLAAWVAVARARAGGSAIQLTAELGLWGYTPTPADPYIFNHRVFPGSPMLADASTVLGMVVGGPGTRTVACLGAAQVDRDGNLNSTLIPGGPVPGGLGRSQRRGQPRRGVCGGGPGPAGPAGGAGGIRDQSRRAGRERRHRPRGAAPPRRHTARRGGSRRPGPGVGAGPGAGGCLWVGRRRGVVGE